MIVRSGSCRGAGRKTSNARVAKEQRFPPAAEVRQLEVLLLASRSDQHVIERMTLHWNSNGNQVALFSNGMSRTGPI